MAFVVQWWMYLLVILIGLLAGALLVSVGYFFHAMIQSKQLKKKMQNMPKDKALVSQWLEQDNVKKVTLNGGPITRLDEKEAEKDERERFEKFREFEKLRRFDKPTTASNSGVEQRKDIKELSGRNSIPSRINNSPSTDQNRVEFE